MTTPDGLTAETLVKRLVDAVWGGYTRPDDTPGILLAIADWMDNIDDIADQLVDGAVQRTMQADLRRVARHIRERYREALQTHRLMFPPHPHGFYIHSALCSCGTWQWDGPGPDLSPMAEQVWADWSDHLHAALATAQEEAPK